MMPTSRPPDYVLGLGRRHEWPDWFRHLTPEQQSLWARWIDGETFDEPTFRYMSQGTGSFGYGRVIWMASRRQALALLAAGVMIALFAPEVANWLNLELAGPTAEVLGGIYYGLIATCFGAAALLALLAIFYEEKGRIATWRASRTARARGGA